MNQISILTWCPQALENLQIRYPTHVQKRFSKFRKLGSRNLPLPWSFSFSELLSPLPTPFWTFRSASMDFFFFLRNIYFYLFGCVASYLQHTRSLLFIMDVGSSSIRDKTRTPCIGSTESEPLDRQGSSSMDFWRTAKQLTEAVEALRIFPAFPDRIQNVFIHEEKLLLESIIARWRVKGLQ